MIRAESRTAPVRTSTCVAQKHCGQWFPAPRRGTFALKDGSNAVLFARRAGLLSAAAAVLLTAGCTQAAPPTARKTAAAQPPAPDLSLFLAEEHRIRDTTHIDLDGDGIGERVLTTVLPASGSRGVPIDRENLLVLAWDAAASRWTTVFDATRHAAPEESDLPHLAVTTPEPAWNADADEPLIPDDAPGTEMDIQIDTSVIRWAAGTDLAFSITRGMADGPYTTVSVVRFADQVARVIYHAQSERLQVIDRADEQRLRLTGALLTATDPSCCPARTYTLEVAPTGPEHSYRVVADDRAWLGAYALIPPQVPDGQVVIAAVAPDSPAAAALRPGDILDDVDAVPTPSTEAYGPAVLAELTAVRPGQRLLLAVRRNGQRLMVPVTAVALSDPRAPTRHFSPGLDRASFGVSLDPSHYGPGAALADVDHDGAAAAAGLRPGDVITSVGRLRIADHQDLVLAGFRYRPADKVTISYLDPEGVQHHTQLTLATPRPDAPLDAGPPLARWLCQPERDPP